MTSLRPSCSGPESATVKCVVCTVLENWVHGVSLNPSEHPLFVLWYKHCRWCLYKNWYHIGAHDCTCHSMRMYTRSQLLGLANLHLDRKQCLASGTGELQCTSGSVLIWMVHCKCVKHVLICWTQAPRYLTVRSLNTTFCQPASSTITSHLTSWDRCWRFRHARCHYFYRWQRCCHITAIRWIFWFTLKWQRRNATLRKLSRIKLVCLVTKKGRLRWCRHFEVDVDADWIKRCATKKVEGVR